MALKGDLYSLETELMGLKLKNPFGLASCSLGTRADQLIKAAESGLGFVVSKSTSRDPRTGFAGRRIYVDDPFLNAEGLPNLGVRNVVEIIGEYKSRINDVPLIVSVIGLGQPEEEYRELSVECAGAGADAIELNLSCGHKDPRKPHFRLIVQDSDLVEDIVKDVKNSIDIPVIAKLSSAVRDIGKIAKAAEHAGADAVSAINTVPAMFIEVDKKGKEGMPVLSNLYGGLSGPHIHPIALKCVFDICQAVDIPVIAYGGVENYESGVRFLNVGAKVFGAASVFYRERNSFQNVVPRVLEGLGKYMEEHGYKRVDEMVGLSHGYQKNVADGKIIGNPIKV